MIRTIILLSVAVVSACAVEHEPLTDNVDQPLAIEACHGKTTDAGFTLEKVARDGSDLVVDLRTGGGCGAHHFDVCWNGLVQPSAPPMIGLELTQQSNDVCEALLTLEVRIDTSTLRARGLLPAILYVGGADRQADGVNTGTLVE